MSTTRLAPEIAQPSFRAKSAGFSLASGAVILSGVARVFAFPASFRGRATQSKDLSRIENIADELNRREVLRLRTPAVARIATGSKNRRTPLRMTPPSPHKIVRLFERTHLRTGHSMLRPKTYKIPQNSTPRR